ncbi:methyltransferase domain-containing protein [Parapedobacter koreensis]|uniref:Trans-aconitate methyltransferase n=1 Tax=Parapedobacter koreensis TaxID=332977 RepID=A0A1H7F876_9SPHI|nr:methyltransferase domain-containing protein [Parapedobacter koreensis]SEK20572.1 Trans-aconitate methyltransferase [Parapedobacter koreensis]
MGAIRTETSSLTIHWNPDLYDTSHGFVSQYGEDLVALLKPQQGERILDLGCGSGQLTHEISLSGARVTGIDNSESMIKKAQATYRNVQFVQASATEYLSVLPFDAVFSNAALHWILEKEKAVAKMAANLATGGRLVLEMGGAGNVAGITTALKQTLSTYGYTHQAHTVQWYFPTLGAYCSLLEEHGFRVNFASHFDRETELKDNENGIKDWLRMFAVSYLDGVTDTDSILEEVQQRLYPTHFRDGKWYADYKRLRILATKN